MCQHRLWYLTFTDLRRNIALQSVVKFIGKCHIFTWIFSFRRKQLNGLLEESGKWRGILVECCGFDFSLYSCLVFHRSVGKHCINTSSLSLARYFVSTLGGSRSLIVWTRQLKFSRVFDSERAAKLARCYCGTKGRSAVRLSESKWVQRVSFYSDILSRGKTAAERQSHFKNLQ